MSVRTAPLLVVALLATALALGVATSCKSDGDGEGAASAEGAVGEPGSAPPAAAEPAAPPRPTLSPAVRSLVEARLAAGDAAAAAGPSPVRPIAIHHPLEGTVFPADMRSPLVDWETSEDAADDGSRQWVVAIRAPSGAVWIERAEEPRWFASREDWEAVKADCREADGAGTIHVLAVTGGDEPRVVAAGVTTFRISEHPVGAPVVYRLVPLPLPDPEDYGRIEWRRGDVSSYEEPRLLVTGLKTCLNCHTASLDGSTVGFDANFDDRDRSNYVTARMDGPTVTLTKDRTFSWTKFREDRTCPSGGPCRAGYASPSPDGRYFVAAAAAEDVVVSPFADPNHTLQGATVYGILAIHDTETGEVTPLPGADDHAYVHAQPVFTPDGETIVFGRAKVREELLGWSWDYKESLLKLSVEELREKQHLQLDLYRIPFNGGKGGEPTPIAGAGSNGKNNYAPKVSPDGRWIAFNQSETGIFIPTDSDLYVVPLEGGEARRLACNSPRMDSWHTWSPNAKWLAWASKRDSAYTNLYLTHIDDEGRSSPPILLPDFRHDDLAVNLPEFFPIDADRLLALEVEKAIDVYQLGDD